MRSIKKLLAACLLVGLTCSYSQANITYTASRAVGTGNVNLSITTDGTLGALATGNLLDWTIGMTDGSDSFTLLGPLSGNNSHALINDTALTASLSDLFFDYNAANGFLLIQSPNIGSGQLFWSVQISGSFDFAGPAEAIDPRNNFSFTRSAHSGNLSIASAEAPVVPAPAASMFGLAGFGLLALRRARRA